MSAFASVVMTVCVLVWACFVAYMSGMMIAHVIFDVNYPTFANFVLVDAGDVIVGLTKCIAYGTAIPIVSAQRGLATFGGSEGVGWATTSAVVSSSLAVIVLQFIISAHRRVLEMMAQTVRCLVQWQNGSNHDAVAGFTVPTVAARGEVKPAAPQ